MVSLGNNIKRIRLEKKLSRRELAELTGVSQGYLTQIEFDKKNPTLETLKKLANGLNVKIEEFTQDVNSEEIKTFGSELDKRCKEYGIDLSELNDEDLDLLAGNIFVLAKKILKNKEDKAD
ncbi:TPA: helix-turn-helix transcriptional regulator [Clostridium perfringens]|nr:helix-turn-helix transcriptional regulator [Clostridium perfringens]HAT4146090.1 helix-turn-helix transcriptional regulator [Clostridium perfringens]